MLDDDAPALDEERPAAMEINQFAKHMRRRRANAASTAPCRTGNRAAILDGEPRCTSGAPGSMPARQSETAGNGS